MANFPHAFQKLLLATNATAFNATGDAIITSVLAGQVAIMDFQNHLVVDVSNVATAAYTTLPLMYLAQGSFHTVDILGGSFHGGYKETTNSKGINPKYVSEFYVTEPGTPRTDIWEVCASGCELDCESTLRLRVDLKDSPVLRALGRNLYFTADGYTGCCDDPVSPGYVDPNVVFLQWMDRINEYPLTKPFAQATVWNQAIFAVDPTGEASADAFLTMTDRTGISADMKVQFTPSTGSTTGADSACSGTILTIGTVAAVGLFSVGQVLTGTGVIAGTKIVSRVSGGGGTGSVFLVDIPQVWDSVALTSVTPITAFVLSTYVDAVGAGDVALVAADTLYTASTTNVTAFTTAALTAVDFFTSIDSDTYVPVTSVAGVAAVVSCLVVEAAYMDTTFGNCSFSPLDHYELTPIQINLSITDETGDPCVVQCMTETEVQNAYMGKGYGEPLLREYILFKRYRQEAFHEKDVRLREITDDTTMTDLNRTGKYFTYNILHSVPRKSNSSGLLDNDQYLIKIVVDARDDDFEAWMNAYLTSANNAVQLEVKI